MVPEAERAESSVFPESVACLLFPVLLVGAESLGVVAGSMLGVADREAAPEAALTRWPRAGQFRGEEDGFVQYRTALPDERD